MSKNLAFVAILAAAGISVWSRDDKVEEPTAKVPKSERIQWISKGGDAVDIEDHLASDGGWTIIEFTGDW